MYSKLRKLWDILVGVLAIALIAAMLIGFLVGEGDERARRASDPKYQEYLRSGAQIDYTYEEWLRLREGYEDYQEYLRDRYGP